MALATYPGAWHRSATENSRSEQPVKPALGMTCAFTPEAVEALAGLPAQVIAIGPRFRSGDYLVTLEYARPVKVGNEIVTRIDAFASELCAVGGHRSRGLPHGRTKPSWWARH